MDDEIKLYTQSDVDAMVALRTSTLEKTLKQERRERIYISQQCRALKEKIRQLEAI